MAKTAEAVSSFLSELGKKLRPLGDADLAEMLHLKEAEVSFLFLPTCMTTVPWCLKFASFK